MEFRTAGAWPVTTTSPTVPVAGGFASGFGGACWARAAVGSQATVASQINLYACTPPNMDAKSLATAAALAQDTNVLSSRIHVYFR